MIKSETVKTASIMLLISYASCLSGYIIGDKRISFESSSPQYQEETNKAVFMDTEKLPEAKK